MDVQDDRITLRLEAGKVTASEFKKAVNSFLDMIHEVADEVAGKRRAVSWVVSVETGSTCLVAEAVPATSADLPTIPRTVAAIKDGMYAIAKGPGIPQYFSEAAVQHVSDLAVLTGKGEGRQSVSLRFGSERPVELSQAYVDNVAKVFAVHTKSLGSIEGRLEMLSLRSGFKCHIYDALTDRRVSCTYDSVLFEQVRAALGERVSAYGIISYTSEARPISLKIQSVRVLGRGELPGWGDVRGILEG
jgi:hypothetical protein